MNILYEIASHQVHVYEYLVVQIHDKFRMSIHIDSLFKKKLAEKKSLAYG